MGLLDQTGLLEQSTVLNGAIGANHQVGLLEQRIKWNYWSKLLNVIIGAEYQVGFVLNGIGIAVQMGLLGGQQ
jgi:hypothetical protein